MARRRQRQLRVIVGPSGPQPKWVKPESTDVYGWDDKLYHKGMVNIEGYYNPIEVKASEVATDGGQGAVEAEVELLPSQNYKTALLANEIIPKAFDPINMEWLTKLLYVAIAGSALSALFGIIILNSIV